MLQRARCYRVAPVGATAFHFSVNEVRGDNYGGRFSDNYDGRYARPSGLIAGRGEAPTEERA